MKREFRVRQTRPGQEVYLEMKLWFFWITIKTFYHSKFPNRGYAKALEMLEKLNEASQFYYK